MVKTLSALKSMLGGKTTSLSIPIMDGPFKPNNLLESATVVVEREGLEDLAVADDGALLAACGRSVLRLEPSGECIRLAEFDHKVTALAVLSDGAIAVGLGDAVQIADGNGVFRAIEIENQKFVAVNALQADGHGSVLISDGSLVHAYDAWSHDLLGKGRTGRLFSYERSTSSLTVLASGLEYSFGACADDRGRALVSESWRHRVSAVVGGSAKPLATALPGYPARISRAPGGGFWLCLFACRTQLVEFVLNEDDYREDMLRTIRPEHWIAPALSSGDDFLEPLQGGGVKQMGVLKPWAPPRSYGLVVRMDANFAPRYSFHSRVGGKHHGVVAAVQRGDDLFVLSKGASRVLKLSAGQMGKETAP